MEMGPWEVSGQTVWEHNSKLQEAVKKEHQMEAKKWIQNGYEQKRHGQLVLFRNHPKKKNSMFARENLTAFRKSERTKASSLLLHTYSALENVNAVKSAVGMSLRLCFAYVKPRAPGFTVTVPIGSASESAQSTSDEVSTTRQSRRHLLHQHFFGGRLNRRRISPPRSSSSS